MSKETVFFSYSRVDSGFALKLARDLRNAGTHLWIDQLDIRPGSHWDASIEVALGTSSSMIIILSPQAVASNNVMDEVSYGLECGKRIIPILLKDCTTPFRLRRLQRIDFTGDYQIGFNQLLETLGHSTSNNSINERGETEPEDEIEIENKDEPIIEANRFPPIPIPDVPRIPETNPIQVQGYIPVQNLTTYQHYPEPQTKTFHKQRLFALVIAGITFLSIFLPWWSFEAEIGDYKRSEYGNGFNLFGLFSIIGILVVVVVSLVGDKSQAYKGKTKIIVLLAFGIIALRAITNILFNSGSGSGIEIRPGIGAWLTLVSGVAGLVIVSGVVKVGAATQMNK